MSEMKSQPSIATVIGDVVRSRTSPDRFELHGRLVTLLDHANKALRPAVPLRITVGDEFQGCFTTVGEAVHATLWLRLHLAPHAELRHGVGWGEVAVLAERPRVEDGPGWWAARAAIEWVKLEAGKASMRHLRTAYRPATQDEEDGQIGGPDPALVNAALMCRDQMVGSASERSLRLLRGMLTGQSQVELAKAEGISASAVSQRVRNDGLAVIIAADELLRSVG
jgi:hypothetical protein